MCITTNLAANVSVGSDSALPHSPSYDRFGPPERTSPGHLAMSQKCQFRTHAEQQISPDHSSSVSARTKNVSGIARPIALAVFRLMANSDGPSHLTSRAVTFGSVTCSAMLFQIASSAALPFTMAEPGGNAVACSVSKLLSRDLHASISEVVHRRHAYHHAGEVASPMTPVSRRTARRSAPLPIAARRRNASAAHGLEAALLGSPAIFEPRARNRVD